MRTKRLLLFALLLCSCMGAVAHRTGIYFYFDCVDKHIYEDNNVQVFLFPTDKGHTGVCVHNKTNKVVYVDNGASFFYTNGKAESMYKARTTMTGTSHSTGISVNLGGFARTAGIGGSMGSILSGMNVGSSSGVMDGVYVSEKRIIPVAPQSTEVIFVRSNSVFDELVKKGNIVDYKNDTKSIKGFYQTHCRYRERGVGMMKMKNGASREYSANNTVLVYKSMVKYSFSESMAGAQDVTVDNYLKAWVVDTYRGVKNYEYTTLPYCEKFRDSASNFSFWQAEKDGKMINWGQVVAVELIATGIGALLVY